MAQLGLRTGSGGLATTPQSRKVGQTRSFRGSKSRNKVSVGEPAEGSLPSEGPLGPTSHPCLSYLVASAGPPHGRRGASAPGPAPAEDTNELCLKIAV